MQSQKHIDKRATALAWIFSFLTVILLIIPPAYLHRLYPDQLSFRTTWIGIGASVGYLLLLFVIGRICARLFAKSHDPRNLKKTRDLLFESRATAEKSLSPFYRKIFGAKIFTFIWFLLVFLGFCAISFFTALLSDFMSLFLLLALSGFLSIYYRLFYRFRWEGPNPVAKADYPALYNLAEQAKKAVGISGDAKIVIIRNSSASITKIGRDCILMLGIHLITLLSEEELYQVMLHEFGHLRAKDPISRYPQSLCNRFLAAEKNSSAFNFLFDVFLPLPMVVNDYIYAICQNASSEIMEQQADRTILEIGDPAKAASALCKSSMTALFEREIDRFLPESFYTPEKCPEDIILRYTTAIRSGITERGADWREILLYKELPYAMGTHPIFRDRWQALGAPDFVIDLPDLNGDSPYIQDLQAAIRAYQQKWTEEFASEYDKLRKENYLDPLEIVEKYKNSDELPAAPNLPELLFACERLVRIDLQEEICDRALNSSMTDFESVCARFVKGKILLNRGDSAGIKEIYRSIEINDGYAESGLDVIADFCHWNGLENEMEEYRRRSIEIMQNKVDFDDQIGSLSPSDNLSVEHFPDDRLPTMLEYMVGVGQEKIQRIYLLHKTITDTVFTSAFVIEFKPDALDTVVNEVMGKIFNYLDNCPIDWQYSLFLYASYNQNVIKAVKKVPDCVVWECPNESDTPAK